MPVKEYPVLKFQMLLMRQVRWRLYQFRFLDIYKMIGESKLFKQKLTSWQQELFYHLRIFGLNSQV